MKQISCPKKNKNCELQFCMSVKGTNNFTCTGYNKKPIKYKKDNICLCLNGKLSKESIEMTPAEALLISGALSLAVMKVCKE